MGKQNRNFNSPFLNEKSFEPEINILSESESSRIANWESEEPASPFLSTYQINENITVFDPQLEAVSTLATEMYSHEFDDAVYELINEATVLYENQIEGETSSRTTSDREAMFFLEEHYSPLVSEVENLLEKMSEDIDQHNIDTMSESELDEFMDQYKMEQHYSPAFEHGFWNRIKKVARRGIRSGIKWAKKKAKKLAMRLAKHALKKLKRYIKPLLKKVLSRAIRKLPGYLQPVARKLAKRYGLQELENVSDTSMFIDTVPDVSEIQYEFNYFFANLVLSDSEEQQNQILNEALVSNEDSNNVLNDVEKARNEFVTGLSQLEEGEDPTELVENFLPAIIPLVKLGLKFYGRPKLVNFLAKYLARLIKRFVGRKYSTVLSRAIVDAGLRLVGLELTPEEEANAPFESIASTIEETVRRVSALPDYVLENEELLEGFVLQAFEESLVGNFPQVLHEQSYEEHPELRETSAKNKGMWMLYKKRGIRRFKKYSHVLRKKLDPHKIRALKTWKGRSLARVLRKKMGIAIGKEFEANIHLYEVLPGTMLSEINNEEKYISGLGSKIKGAWSQLHPLTPEAAGILFGQPGLGRKVPKKYLVDPKQICVGQRFYFIESPDLSGMTSTMHHHSQPCCDTHLVFDFIKNRIQVNIFISEADAQQIAIKLNKKLPIGSVLAALNARYAVGVKNAFSKGMVHQVKVIHGSMSKIGSSWNAFKWIPLTIQEQLKERLLEWLGMSLYRNFKQTSAEFTSSVQNQELGVTIKVNFNNVTGLISLGKILAGESVALHDIEFSENSPDSEVRLAPGFRYE